MSEFSFDKLAHQLRNSLGSGQLSGQIEAALRMAWDGHEGQFREQIKEGDSKIPYIVHPVGVALLAIELMPLVILPDSLDDIVSVCLTHDLIEDCDITAHELANATSRRTSELVEALTKPPSKGGDDSKRRNEEAFTKIVSAGPTAMFIKICDHLHNISRPQSTPPKLLGKAIRKGWDTNLRYFETGALSEKLKDEYVERLRVAEAFHRNHSTVDTPTLVLENLSDAIGYCVKQTEAKMLEAHDIVEVIKTISNARFALLSSSSRFIDFAFDAKALRLNQKFNVRLKALINEGAFDTSIIPNGIAGSFLSDIERVIVIPMQLSSTEHGASDLLFVGLQADGQADWLNRDSLRVLLSFLSDRLRQHIRKNHIARSNRLAELGLKVSADEVEVLQLGYSDLEKLHNVLKRADFVRRSLVARLIYDFAWDLGKFEFPRIESRTKEASSIIKKMISKKYTSAAQLGDVIGIRVICGTDYEAVITAERAAEIIKSAFECSSSTEFRIGNTKLDVVTSTAGYRAKHLTCVIKGEEASSIEIGCEIQFRSAYQDAWARLSHDLNYKPHRGKTRLIADGMEKLADMRDQMDGLANKLVTK